VVTHSSFSISSPELLFTYICYPGLEGIQGSPCLCLLVTFPCHFSGVKYKIRAVKRTTPCRFKERRRAMLYCSAALGVRVFRKSRLDKTAMKSNCNDAGKRVRNCKTNWTRTDEGILNSVTSSLRAAQYYSFLPGRCRRVFFVSLVCTYRDDGLITLDLLILCALRTSGSYLN